MKKIGSLVASWIVATLTTAQIKVGDTLRMRPLRLTPVQGAAMDSTKLMVLDFWATWCGPCIAAFPHLDSLQRKYQPWVQVVALSDEPAAKVAAFIHQRPHPFQFFTDEKRQVFKLFDVEAIPLTALVAPSGVLRWVGSAYELDDILAQLTTGQDSGSRLLGRFDFSYRKYYTRQDVKTADDLYTYHISLSGPLDEYEAKVQKGPQVHKPIHIYYRATPITEVLMDLLDLPPLQVTNLRPELDTVLINLTARSHSAAISYRAEVKKIVADLGRIFHITIQEKTVLRNGYQLKVVDASLLARSKEVFPGGGMVKASATRYAITRLSLNDLAGFFQKKLGAFVAYEGTEAAQFNLDLAKFNNVQELNKALREQYGLVLAPRRLLKKMVTLH